MTLSKEITEKGVPAIQERDLFGTLSNIEYFDCFTGSTKYQKPIIILQDDQKHYCYAGYALCCLGNIYI